MACGLSEMSLSGSGLPLVLATGVSREVGIRLFEVDFDVAMAAICDLTICSESAVFVGLANVCVADDELDATVQARAEEISTRNPTANALKEKRQPSFREFAT